MIIDVHLHCNVGIERVISHMDNTGVSKCWALALEEPKLKEFSCPTELGLAGAERYPDRIIPFCHVDVRREDAVDRILRYASMGCKGFGEHKMHISVDDERMMRIYDVCNELCWPVLIHFQETGANGGYSWGIERFDRIVKRYPNIKFVGHAGSWWQFISADASGRDGLDTGRIVPIGLIDRLLGMYPNLYADLSAGSGLNALTRDVEFMRDFIVRHRKKLLFGSDCSCDGTDENCYAKLIMSAIRALTSDDSVLQDIFYGNAFRLVADGKDDTIVDGVTVSRKG